MIQLKLSECLRQVRDQFAPHCQRGVVLRPETVRDLVSLLTVYGTAAERLEGVTLRKTIGEIIELRPEEFTRTVAVPMEGEVS